MADINLLNAIPWGQFKQKQGHLSLLPFSCPGVFTSSRCDKSWPKEIVECKACSPPWSEIKGGTQGRNRRQRPWKNVVYWHSPWLTQPAFIDSPAHLPRGGPSHSELGPSTSITVQENVPTVILTEIFSQLRIFLPSDRACVKLRGEMNNW